MMENRTIYFDSMEWIIGFENIRKKPVYLFKFKFFVIFKKFDTLRNECPFDPLSFSNMVVFEYLIHRILFCTVTNSVRSHSSECFLQILEHAWAARDPDTIDGSSSEQTKFAEACNPIFAFVYLEVLGSTTVTNLEVGIRKIIVIEFRRFLRALSSRENTVFDDFFVRDVPEKMYVRV